MVDEEKAILRKAAYVIRRPAFAAGQGQAATFLAGYLAQFGGVALAGYMPMRTEIDPLPAMAAHQGPVGVPVIMARATPLQFRSWSPVAEMVAGEFGALIPANGDWIAPRVLIVPLLAFDTQGYRLGYGGGFYDRTLAELRARGPVTAVGYAFAAQRVDAVPIDGHDQRLDAVVTEQGVLEF